MDEQPDKSLPRLKKMIHELSELFFFDSMIRGRNV